MSAVIEKIRQRSDYTQKFNENVGRHGWLRLTPAYSVKMVNELVGRRGRPTRVLDPFCGTATTALSAAYRGHECVTVDVNPFLTWLGQVKTVQYSSASIDAARCACKWAVQTITRGAVEPIKAPPMHNIERWWSRDALDFLCMLKACIESKCHDDFDARNILLVAFCKTLIKLSNAAFNHQSMSFNDNGRLDNGIDMERMFVDDVEFVLEGATENPKEKARVVIGDARNLTDSVNGHFDLVVTSPPYVNRMSYVRELRPYMYWLGFLDNGRDAGELDWLSIGGTWGVATSRLANWKRPDDSFDHPDLGVALDKISHHDNKNGKIMSNYVAKYFDDMWTHFNSLSTVLNDKAEVHYIVGNSTFYDSLLPVERLYVVMLERLGFDDVKCKPIRKRNSKKELFEFDVSARWTS